MVLRTEKIQHNVLRFTTALVMEIDDLLNQLVTTELGFRRPEVTARDNERCRPSRRLHHAAQGFVRVKADDEVVVIRHGSIEILDPDGHPLKAPATRIDEFSLVPVTLPQEPGEHALPARDVGDIARVRETAGDELGYDLKSCRVTMKPVPTHSNPRQAVPTSRRLPLPELGDLFEPALTAAGREHLDDAGRGVLGVPHGVQHASRLERPRAWLR
ncbi:MAG TPA: hypothetical protein VH589_27810 [Trebonia sp.]